MPFSPELPFAAVTTLIDVVTPGGKVFSTREVVEAAYDVLGYVLGQMLSKPVIKVFGADGFEGKSEAELLKLLLVKGDGQQADIPWALIFQLITKLIDIWANKDK